MDTEGKAETEKNNLKLYEIKVTPLPLQHPPVMSFIWIRKNPGVQIGSYEDDFGRIQHFSWVPKDQEPRYISISRNPKFSHINLVKDTKLGRVAIAKASSKGMGSGWTMFKDITEETHNAAILSHSNIAKIYDLAAGPDKSLYAIMEYLPNGMLEDWMKENHSIDEIESVIDQIASAIHYVNTKGNRVYADTKPLNIGFDEDMNPKLIDFEYAAIIRKDSTAENKGAQTPVYAAPEQRKGESLTIQTDVYSLGATVFSMFIKVLDNYHDYDMDKILTTFRDDPNAEIPFRDTYDKKLSNEQKRKLNAVLHKALSKEPTQRHSSVRQFNEEFQHAMNITFA